MQCEICESWGLWGFLHGLTVVVTGESMTVCTGCLADVLAIFDPEVDLVVTTVQVDSCSSF